MSMILALFAVAPAADPKSLLGAIDVPCKMSGYLKFSILKIRFSNLILFFQISNFLKKHFSKATVNLNKNDLFLRSPGSIGHEVARLLNLVAQTTTAVESSSSTAYVKFWKMKKVLFPRAESKRCRPKSSDPAAWRIWGFSKNLRVRGHHQFPEYKIRRIAERRFSANPFLALRGGSAFSWSIKSVYFGLIDCWWYTKQAACPPLFTDLSKRAPI